MLHVQVMTDQQSCNLAKTVDGRVSMCIPVIGILQFNCIRLKGGHVEHLWHADTDTYVCFLQNLCLLLEVSEEIADPCLHCQGQNCSHQ